MATLVSFASSFSTLTNAEQGALAALVADNLISADAGNGMALGSDDLLYSSATGLTAASLAVTGINALSALPSAPLNVASAILTINGIDYSYASGAFTIAGTTVTIVPAVLGYNIDTFDTVSITYA